MKAKCPIFFAAQNMCTFGKGLDIGNLDAHMGERPYSCEVGCGYFARTRSALGRHIATRHGRGE